MTHTMATRPTRLHSWRDRLAREMAAGLEQSRARLACEQLCFFAVDCHPWHGHIGLCLLTVPEAAADPGLRDPAQMASWRLFHFAQATAAHGVIEKLAQEMELDYRGAEDLAETATAYLRVTAEAVASAPVQAALGRVFGTPDFRVSVAHPDTGEEFCASEMV